jgi:hypothetical protein
MSCFQPTFHFGEQVTNAEGPNPVIQGLGIQVLECTYGAEIASRRGHYEVAHCLGAISMICSSTVCPFRSHSFSELGQDLQIVRLINCLTFRCPFNRDYATDGTENGRHCHHLRHVYFC